jgi:hypothetical protein
MKNVIKQQGMFLAGWAGLAAIGLGIAWFGELDSRPATSVYN